MTVDPYAMALFQNLGNAASSVGKGLLGKIENDVLQKQGAVALLSWLENPSPENFAKASQYGTLQDFLSLLKATSDLEKQEVETGILQQQRIALEDQQQGVRELASAMNISPGLAQLMLSNPNLLNTLSGDVDALAHLQPEERKAYFENVQSVRNDLESASLAYRLAVHGEPSYLDELHRLRPVNENRLKRLRGHRGEAQTHGMHEAKAILSDMARKRVISRLAESRNLSQDQRRALETQIFSSPDYHDLVVSVSRGLLSSSDEFNPGIMLEAVDRFVDQFSGFGRVLSGESSEDRSGGKVELGREFRPRGGGPTLPKGAIESPSEIVPRETVMSPSSSSERDIVDDGVLSFKGSFKNFKDRAQSHYLARRFSDQDLQEAYDNHRLLSRIRKSVRASDGKKFGDEAFDPVLMERAKELGLKPWEPVSGGRTADERAELVKRDQRILKQVALESAMIEDMFHLGTPPSKARGMARETLESLPSGMLTELLDQMQTREDILDAMDVVLGLRDRGDGSFGRVAEVVGGPDAMVEMPEEIAVDMADSIRDTIVVGGIRGLASAGDGLFWGATYGAISAATGVGGAPLLLGIASVYGATGVYADRRNLQQDRYYKAFFVSPTTKTREGRNFVERKRFADEFASEFTPDERRQLIDGTYKDMAKVKDLIYRKSIGDRFVEFLNSPTGYVDRRTLNLINRAEEAFPGYSESAVRGAEVFGSLTGLGGAGKILGRGSALVKGARPEVLEINPTFRSRLASARSRVIRHLRGSRPSSPEKTAFDRLFERWAQESGNISYAPYSQQGRWFSLTNDLARRATIAGVYSGADYWMDQAFDDAEFYRRLLWVGTNIGGGLVEGQYYRTRSKSFDVNSQWQEQQFSQFGRDFGGGPKPSKGGDLPSGKGPKGSFGAPYKYVVIDAPQANKQVIYKPGGIIEVSSSPTGATNIPEGPVSRNEFTKSLSSNLMSLQGLSKNMRIPVPDFARSEASSVVDIDMDAVERFVRESWQKKEEAVEFARRGDLSELVPHANIKEAFGNKYEGKFPKTNDLQLLATQAYGHVEDVLAGVRVQPIVKALDKRLGDILSYFEAHPTLGAQSAKKLAETVRSTIHHRDFQASAILEYHRKINQERRALNEALEKEYSPDKSQLLEFYNALDHAIRNALPDDAKFALETADNIYRAYKFSQAVDGFLDRAVFENIDKWATQPNKFKEIAGAIYDELKDSNTASELRKSFLHDEYIRDAMTRKNISWSRAGEVFRRGHAIDSAADFRDAAIAIQRTLPFGKSGAGGRFAGHVLGKVGRLKDQQTGEQAVSSTPHYQSKEYRDIVDIYEKAHQLRKARSPAPRSQEPPPLIVDKIDAYLAREAERTKKAIKAEYARHQEEAVKGLGRRLLAIEQGFDDLTHDPKTQGKLVKEVEDLIQTVDSISRNVTGDSLKLIKDIRRKAVAFIDEHAKDVAGRLKKAKTPKEEGKAGLFPRKTLSKSIEDMRQAPPQTLSEVVEQKAIPATAIQSPSERLLMIKKWIDEIKSLEIGIGEEGINLYIKQSLKRIENAIQHLDRQLTGEEASQLVYIRKDINKIKKKIAKK